MEHGRTSKADSRACCVSLPSLFGFAGSQLRIKDATKQVQQEASSCIGSHRVNRNGVDAHPKSNGDQYETNADGVRTVVFPTSVSLVEPDAVGFDLRTPGLVSDAKPADALSGQEAYRQNLHQQMLSKQSPTSEGSTSSMVTSDSPTNGAWLVSEEDANIGMEIDHQSVNSSAPGETVEEMEARVRREVETQIRQEMEAEMREKIRSEAEAEARAKAAKEAEAEAARMAAIEEEEEAARMAAQAEEAASEAARRAEAEADRTEALAQQARDSAAKEEAEAAVRAAELAVAEAEAEAARAAGEAARRKAAALSERAEGLIKAGHAANKQNDYKKARKAFQEAYALENKPAVLVSAANMALKDGDASTAKREYEQALKEPGLSDAVTKSINVKLEEAKLLMKQQVRDAKQKQEQRVTSLEKLHYLRLEDIATLDTAAFREAIATAEGCGVEPAEVEGARKTLKQAETVQEASRKKKEKVALDELRAATAPAVAAIDEAALRAALDKCAACDAQPDKVAAGLATLEKVVRWRKAEAALAAALAPADKEAWDLPALRLAVDEAKAVGLPRADEGAATLARQEEAAKERAVKLKMRREAEKNLNSAMPSMFGKADAARLGKAVDIAKKAGVDKAMVEAAEQKLAVLREAERKKQEEEQRKREEEERMRPIIEAARREAEAKAKAEAEARAVAAARQMAEEKVRLESEAQARAAAEGEAKRLAQLKAEREAAQAARRAAEEAVAAEAAALAREDAATELRLVMAATQVDLPRMIRAVEVADETGVDRAAIAAAQQTIAKAQRRAAAKEELAAALLPSVEELSNQETLLLRLRAAAAEAEEVGLPSLSAAQQKMVAAEKVVAQREELARHEASRRVAEERVRREAEEQLKAALPGLLKAADPIKLQAAIEAARAAGVAPPTVAAAEAKLLEIVAKEEGRSEKTRLSAEAAAELARREEEQRQRLHEEALVAATKPSALGLGSVDADKLEAAIGTARAHGVSEAKLIEAEAKLARVREESAAAKMSAQHATYEKELKAAAGLSGFFGASEVTDVARLELAIDSARAAGVTSEVLGKAEAKLAAIRIDAEKKRSFERPEPVSPVRAGERFSPPRGSERRKFEKEPEPLPEPVPEEEEAPPAPPSRRGAPPPVAPRRAHSGTGGFKAVLGGSNPLPFAPSAPGMMEKLTRRDTDEEGGGGGGPAKMGFSSIRGAGPGGAAGASGPKKIKAPSAPLKFAPGAPAAGKPKMMRRNTDESS